MPVPGRGASTTYADSEPDQNDCENSRSVEPSLKHAKNCSYDVDNRRKVTPHLDGQIEYPKSHHFYRIVQSANEMHKESGEHKTKFTICVEPGDDNDDDSEEVGFPRHDSTVCDVLERLCRVYYPEEHPSAVYSILTHNGNKDQAMQVLKYLTKTKKIACADLKAEV